MPSSGPYTWSPELDALIRQESDAAGVPLDLAYAFIAAESGFNAAAHVDNALEDSVGLLQLNRRGGQGTGYSVQQLLDPRANLRIGLPAIRRAFEAAWSPAVDPFEFLYQVATRSGHPGPMARSDPRMTHIAEAWVLFYPAVGSSLVGPHGAPGPAGGAGRVATLAATIPASFAALAVIVSQFSIKAITQQYSIRNIAQREFSLAQIRRQETPSVIARAELPGSFIGPRSSRARGRR